MKNSYFLHLIFQSTISVLLAIFYTCSFAKNSQQNNQIQSQQKLNDLVLEHLKQKTYQKIKNRVISINKISERLKLSVCKNKIELSDNDPYKLLGRTTIKLSCSQPKWKLYVTANINGDLPVVVATKGIIKQTVIKESDIKTIYMPYKKVKPAAMKDLNSVIGMRSKKTIYSNTIITINMLQPPYLVFKNQPITIVSYIRNLKVTSKGIALKSGTEQEQIPFRNISSKKILKGIVIAPNTVLVN
jgi:flagella basal body P-ring formation protein FlgA